MKSLIILASLMVVFLIMPEEYVAQSKQPTSTLPEITKVQMPEALSLQLARR